jgi:hypothetical protein
MLKFDLVQNDKHLTNRFATTEKSSRFSHNEAIHKPVGSNEQKKQNE